jgi:hypothetical protein
MQRIDGPTRSATLPAPNATGTGDAAPGYFGHGDLLTGVPYTTLDPDWCNMVQEEIMGVVVAASLTPSKSDHTQLLTALQTLFVGAGGGSGVIVGANEVSMPLPGGFILKFGTISGTFSEGTMSHTFDNAFPTKCWIVIPVSINSGGDLNKNIWAQRVSLSPSGVVLFNNLSGGTGTNSIDGADFIAIGN